MSGCDDKVKNSNVFFNFLADESATNIFYFIFISVSNFVVDKSANKYTIYIILFLIKFLAVLSYFVADFSANILLRVKSASK
jgi:hypothetical protein